MFGKRRFLRWIGTLVSLVAAAWLINQYGVAMSVVSGTSMAPTLQDGDRLLVNKFRFLVKEPSVGDVITFRDPSDQNRFLVKRVIGVGGDVIEIRGGVVYRNGIPVRETYTSSPVEGDDHGPVKVKPGTVFVLGDNRQLHASRDSRYESVGLVPVNLIDGKVEWILWRPSLAASL
ncbi:signal peptidase I [Staphylospora marina]|uniref:signal peptidase I n=1 Tax=Staphylospora marina TaxID=2490858 RepID=UPI0013DE2552|nr:signal peptidase I [Staphylospora marina]